MYRASPTPPETQIGPTSHTLRSVRSCIRTMADTAGLVLGAIGLTPLVNDIIENVERFRLGIDYKQDHGSLTLDLDLLGVRFAHWAKAVGIVDINRLDTSILAIDDEGQNRIAKVLLQSIAELFEKAKKKSDRTHRETEPQPQPQHEQVGEWNHSQFSEFCHTWSKKSIGHYPAVEEAGKRFFWAVQGKKEFEDLVRELRTKVNDLVELFPAPKPRQQELCRGFLAAIPDGTRVTALYERIAQTDVDPFLQQAAQKHLDRVGHTYDGARVTDDGRLVQGDQMAAGEKAPGNRHQYGKVEVSGRAIAALGDRVGMADIFGTVEKRPTGETREEERDDH